MQVIDRGSNAPAPTQGLDLKKAAVIAKLNSTMNPTPEAPKAPDHPLDASKIAPEDMSAIAPRTETEESVQIHKDDSTAEPAQEAPKVEPAKDERLSAQYAQLARKERAMRLEAQKIRAERDALKAEREALKPAPTPSIDESKYISRDKFESDPLAALAEIGISYDTLTQRALNAPSHEQIELNRTISDLRNEIKSLRDGQEKAKEEFQNAQADGYKQAVAQIRKDVHNLVRDGETYEMIASTRSVGDVVELIERTFKEGLDDERPAGTLLTVDEAAQIVEDHLTEEAFKLAKLKKIQKRLQPAAVTPATPAKTAEGTDQKKPQGQKTLTNSISSARQYTAKQRAMFAAEHGPNWRSKVG